MRSRSPAGQPPTSRVKDVPITFGPPRGGLFLSSIFGSPPLVDLTSTPQGVPLAPAGPPLPLRTSPWATTSLRGLSPPRVSVPSCAESDRPTSQDTFVLRPLLPLPFSGCPPRSLV